MQTATVDPLEACRNCASLVLVLGIGDGSILTAMANDPVIRFKDCLAVAFPGDTVPTSEFPGNFRVYRATCWQDLQQWALAHFSDHKDIVRMGGMDVIDTVPLSEEAEAFRTQHLKRLYDTLGDRPWALGNDVNDSFMGLWHAWLNRDAIMSMPSLGELCGQTDVPTIAIGAGPSIKEHLDELRALQDKCVLVACDSIYPALIQNDIVPHFVTPLERLKQQAQFVQAAKGTRTHFAGIAACHPDTVAPFEGRCIYVHACDKLYDWLAPDEKLRTIVGSSTGVLAIMVAASLTRGKVYLVGHDLAKSATGDTHFAACDFAAKAWDAEKKNAGGHGTNGYETRFIPGNDGSQVESIMWWDHFRAEIASQCALMPGRVVNVNAHYKRYAKIEHTDSAPLPAPESLSALPPISLTKGGGSRLDSLNRRSGDMAADVDRFLAAMRTFRDDIVKTKKASPHTWDLDALMLRMVPDAGVSEGNRAAFQYFLRSAIWNEQSRMAYTARTFKGKTQAFWETMQSLDALADRMMTAVHDLAPLLKQMSK